MDELIEFLLEIVLEGSIELSSNKKVSVWIRYPLIIFLTIFFLVILFLMFYCSITIIEENVFLGISFLGIGLFVLISGIKKVKNIHNSYQKAHEKK